LITKVVPGIVIVIATLHGDVLAAERTGATLTPRVLEEIARVEAHIDRIEEQARERLVMPPDNQVQQIELLGKLMLYDKQLSMKAVTYPVDVGSYRRRLLACYRDSAARPSFT
jgi:branched-subunit amino acid aminotransferase/4-amino-4-deoxychorismate lyase